MCRILSDTRSGDSAADARAAFCSAHHGDAGRIMLTTSLCTTLIHGQHGGSDRRHESHPFARSLLLGSPSTTDRLAVRSINAESLHFASTPSCRRGWMMEGGAGWRRSYMSLRVQWHFRTDGSAGTSDCVHRNWVHLIATRMMQTMADSVSGPPPVASSRINECPGTPSITRSMHSRPRRDRHTVCANPRTNANRLKDAARRGSYQ